LRVRHAPPARVHDPRPGVTPGLTPLPPGVTTSRSACDTTPAPPSGLRGRPARWLRGGKDIGRLFADRETAEDLRASAPPWRGPAEDYAARPHGPQSVAFAKKPRNRANRSCRWRAYHRCRARSLVRLALVPSIGPPPCVAEGVARGPRSGPVKMCLSALAVAIPARGRRENRGRRGGCRDRRGRQMSTPAGPGPTISPRQATSRTQMETSTTPSLAGHPVTPPQGESFRPPGPAFEMPTPRGGTGGAPARGTL